MQHGSGPIRTVGQTCKTVGQTFLSAECVTASCGRQECLPHRFICRHQAIMCHCFAEAVLAKR